MTGPAVYRGRQVPFVVLITLVCLLMPLFVHGDYGQGQLVNVADYAILTLGFYWSFILAGEFTFAVFGFFAIGAYSSVWVSYRTDFWVGLITAAVVCTVVGVPVGRTGVCCVPLLGHDGGVLPGDEVSEGGVIAPIDVVALVALRGRVAGDGGVAQVGVEALHGAVDHDFRVVVGVGDGVFE